MYDRGQVVPLEAAEALAANLRRLPRRNRQRAIQIIEAVDPDLVDVVNARARVTRVAPLQIARVVDEGDIEQGQDEELRQARPVGGKLSIRDLRGLLKQSYNPKKDDYDGWTLDKSLSGQRAKVFQNKETGEAAVVHRGTKGIQDWGNDLKYALGFSIKDSARVKHAKNIQKQAEEKYGKENVSTLGHSLGSKIGREVGKDSKEIISLNGAYAPQDLFKPISNKEFNIRTSLDPVSALLPLKQHKNTFTIPSVSMNPLTEHSVDTLARVDQDKEIGKGRCGGMMKWLGSLLDKTPKLTEAQKVKAEEYADSLMSDPTGISFEGSSLLPKKLRKEIVEEFIKQKQEQIQMGKEDIQTGKGKGKQMSVKELKAYLKQNGKKGFQFGKKTKKELREEVERRKGGALTADQASEVSDTIDRLSGLWSSRGFSSNKVKKAKEQIIKELSENDIQYEITDKLITNLVTKYMTDF
jgi:hypothetical protein